MSEMDIPKRSPGLRSILLGLFVLFQLIYLPLSNLMQLVPREMSAPQGDDIRVQREGTATQVRPVQEAINGLGMFFDHYGEATGQAQVWPLFVDFSIQTIYPIVEFEFGEDNDRYVMRSEPLLMRLNPERYLRWPGPTSRLMSYEFLLAVVYWRYSEESLEQRGPEWRDAVRDHVRRQQKTLDAYFRYNLATLKRMHPELPEPRVGILKVVIHPSPKPGERGRPPTFYMPLARWSFMREEDDKRPSIEAFDPVEKKFVPTGAQ
jgi:hypothetical protein